MLHHIVPPTDAQATPRVASLGGFATPPQLGNTHGNPPQALPIQTIQTQQYQRPPLTRTTSHLSPGSRPMPNFLKQGVPPANIYDPRLIAPFLSANINLSPTSTAGSSGPPPSVGRTTTTATSVSKNANEMEDEPRDFAELPKTSPHFNTHLLLPLPDAARQHAAAAGLGHEEQDSFRTSRLSFSPIFAPVEIIPYGADRVLFVEGLICEYAPISFRCFHFV